MVQAQREVPVLLGHSLHDLGGGFHELLQSPKRSVERQPLTVVAVVQHRVHGNGSQLLDTADVVVSEIFQGREAHTVAVSQELRQVLWLRPVATEGRQQLLATLGEVLLQFVSEVTDLQHHLVLVLPADMVDDLAQSVGKAEGRAGAGQGRGQGQEQGQGQGQGRVGQGRAGAGQGRAGQQGRAGGQGTSSL